MTEHRDPETSHLCVLGSEQECTADVNRESGIAKSRVKTILENRMAMDSERGRGQEINSHREQFPFSSTPLSPIFKFNLMSLDDTTCDLSGRPGFNRIN